MHSNVVFIFFCRPSGVALSGPLTLRPPWLWSTGDVFKRGQARSGLQACRVQVARVGRRRVSRGYARRHEPEGERAPQNHSQETGRVPSSTIGVTTR